MIYNIRITGSVMLVLWKLRHEHTNALWIHANPICLSNVTFRTDCQHFNLKAVKPTCVTTSSAFVAQVIRRHTYDLSNT